MQFDVIKSGNKRQIKNRTLIFPPQTFQSFANPSYQHYSNLNHHKSFMFKPPIKSSSIDDYLMLPKHACPHVHKFRFIETSILILVEHLDHASGHSLVVAHVFSDDTQDLIGGQNAVTVFIQLVKLSSNFLMAVMEEQMVNIQQTSSQLLIF